MKTEPLHFSDLKQMARSPAHVRYSQVAEREDKRHFRIGRIVHGLLLGGHMATYPGAVRRGKEWERFVLDHPGQDIITAKELSDAEPLARALSAHPGAMARLDGEAEQTLDWRWLGRDCRGTPDVVGRDWITDLKTSRNAEPGWFNREGIRYGYHAQLAWYLNGVVLSGAGTPRSAYIVAVESAPPYPVTVMRLTERAIEQGERLCRLWMERYLVCESSAHWPAYCESEVEFDVPDDDFELTFGEESAA